MVTRIWTALCVLVLIGSTVDVIRSQRMGVPLDSTTALICAATLTYVAILFTSEVLKGLKS